MINATLRRWIQVLGLVSLGLSLLVSCSGEASREGEAAVSQIVLNIQPPAANHSLRSPALAELATSRQVTAIVRLQIDVHVPEQEMPIRAQVDNLQSEPVVVEIAVPQGNGRRIEVRAFNAFV